MNRTLVMDLNCDLGEEAAQLGRDVALLKCITSANIACGGHAGDEQTMRAMIEACAREGVRAGAHPGYEDKAGFGRVSLGLSAPEIRSSVVRQLGVLAAIASESGVVITHVKPHGAMYHDAMTRREIAEAVADAALEVVPHAALVGLAGAIGLDWWRARGCEVLAEAFADRRYQPDGSLRPRSLPGAVIDDPEVAAAQAVEIARHGRVRLDDGAVCFVQASTICVHSDSPGAWRTASTVAAALIAQR